jgi:hypothetical protein
MKHKIKQENKFKSYKVLESIISTHLNRIERTGKRASEQAIGAFIRNRTIMRDVPRKSPGYGNGKKGGISRDFCM